MKQLKEYDGTGGRPAYVAYQGKIYDVSRSYLWEDDGLHQYLHQAGQDLTGEMESAPHDPDLLERFPEVGKLIDS